MFGLFKSASFSDPSLGKMVRSRGLWRGTLQLDSGPTPLVLASDRTAPHPAAIAAACDVKTQLPSWRSAIETALFEHYEPCTEALAAGEAPETSGPFPRITSASGVWPHVALEFISVSLLGGSLTTELGYTAAWDEEHTLGARLQGGTFAELCGSVLSP
ncbi:MAG: DUF6985 domain-containing protein [Lysobacter sp.]